MTRPGGAGTPRRSASRTALRSLLLGLTLAMAACSGSVANSTPDGSARPSTPASSPSGPASVRPMVTTTGPTTSSSVISSPPTSSTTTAGTIAGDTITDDTTTVGTPTSTATAGTSADGAPALPAVGLDGVNDPRCRSELPPVVLLHGTFATPAGDFGQLAPALRASGRCVYAVLYGAAFGYGGIGPIADSARSVGAFLDRVRTATRAAAVDVVAFSQGALVLRAALQNDLPTGSVRLAVLLAPDYHGTSVPIVTRVPAALCPSCAEQVRGSTLLRTLDAGGELAPSVRYASLLLDDDAWVQPLAEQSPRGPADRVRVQILQDACPDVEVDHSVLPSSPAAVTWTVSALDSDGRPAGSFACG